MRNLIRFLGIVLVCNPSFAQQIESVDTLHFTTEKSYSRALARYSKNELVFGTSKTGVILYNEQTKRTQTLIKPVSCGEFRDVITDRKKIYTCVSGDCGIIYKISNKKEVTELYRDSSFIDDMVLRGNHQLIVLRDPVNNGLNITVVSVGKGILYGKAGSFYTYGPFKTVEGEAHYAASGTTAQLIENSYYHVSGGPNNATFYKRSTFEYETSLEAQLPFPKAEGAGPFSIFMFDKQSGVVVGGNYTKPDASDSTACYTTDGGKTWKLAEKQPNGYRSCVTGNEQMLFACGSNGIDYSTDKGKTWNFLAKGNFCALLLEKNILYATTNKGDCLKIKLKMNN